MILFLILGVLLGAVSMVFILQNTTVVTVMFLDWHITASLALVLLVAIVSGIVMALLVLLPNLIRDEFYLSAVKKHTKEVENELASTKQSLVEALSRTPNADAVIIERTTL